MAIVGTYRQDRYGNVVRPDALLLGLLSVAGAAGGVALANALSGAFLRDAFAALMVIVAAQLVHRTLRGPESPPPGRRPGGLTGAGRKRRRLDAMGLDNPLHIAFLLIVLLLVFGAKRLPEIGRSVGSGMREFKDSISGDTPRLTQTTQQPQAPAQPVATQAPVATPAPEAVQVPVAAPVQAPVEPDAAGLGGSAVRRTGRLAPSASAVPWPDAQPCRIGPVSTASNSDPGTCLISSRFSSFHPGFGAPVMNHGDPLSATISP